MRHFYFRLAVGVVWLVAAVVSAVNTKFMNVALYGALCLVFLYSAYAVWKKEKNNKE